MVYYIDSQPSTFAFSHERQVDKIATDEVLPTIKPGDKVLFKRGCIFRCALDISPGSDEAPVYYGAYGEGENPVFCGSVQSCNQDDWQEESKNIWTYSALPCEEVASLILGSTYGTFRWSKDELTENGDFYADYMGCINKAVTISNNKIYLYCDRNPVQKYGTIELCIYGRRNLGTLASNIVIENLDFINSGVHGLSGAGKNITIKNCNFKNIGGICWNKEQKIRFGNAIELWNECENVTVEGCTFDEIYDSAVTHQGNTNCKPAYRLIIKGNAFRHCGMAAYEQRDLMTIESEFSNNICTAAGDGFSKLGETMPRFSEIYPEPMGHHIFLWRIENPTDGGGLVIKDNDFGSAPYGYAIYGRISRKAQDQLIIEGNKVAKDAIWMRK